MKNIESNRRNILIGAGLLLLGLFLGWIFFGGNSGSANNNGATSEVSEHLHDEKETIWTCSMHPQIRETEPGNCPICGMELVPLEDNGGGAEVTDYQTEMSASAVQLGNIQTSFVTKQTPEKTIYMPGKVEADERLVESVTSRFPGRIEKLYVNFTGQEVARGQRLASVYSPALVTAQKELFEAAKFKESNPSFYTSAVNKLKLWDLSESQINSILESKEPIYYFDIRSNQSGTVLEKKVEVGDYLKEGQSLFQISNLNKVWAVFDAYESDLPWVKEGDKINFKVQSIPGKTFESTVTFIDPVINSATRVAAVRTEMKNPGGSLKPGMFAQGIVEAGISNMEDALSIPKSAVLWTGKRAVVYVKQPNTENPVFEFREIELGPEAGEYYLVESGLEEGEEIVTNGTFKVDAAAQLQGKASMMSPEGGVAMTGHAGMDMGGDTKAKAVDHSKMNMDDPKIQKEVDHSKMEDNTDHTKMQKRIKVAKEFKNQLKQVFEQYLVLKDAFTNDDNGEAKKSAEALLKSMSKVDMKLLEDHEAHNHWMLIQEEVTASSKSISKTSKIEEQRKHFKHLSAHLIKAVKLFGVDQKVYEQFCPMADDNKGATWLSLSKEIKNPYLGEAMPTCGEIRSTIE